MKSFDAMTRLGRLRRFRKIAKRALKTYGIKYTGLEFLTYNGNIIYRVNLPQNKKKNNRLYNSNRYILRVHMQYHSIETIDSEMKWLSALRNDIDAPVPEPISYPDGTYVKEFGDEAILEKRKCTLLKWVDGRRAIKQNTNRNIDAWGRLMAQFHNHASGWKLPKGFTRPCRDWEGLFDDGAMFENPAKDLIKFIPKKYLKSFHVVKNQSKKVFNKWGKKGEYFGLIHADLNIYTNLLFRSNEARAIDFDDCCFGYWMHDVAFAFAPWQKSEKFDWMKELFFNGYSKIRSLSDEQLNQLDLFLGIYNANLLLWMLDWQKLDPKSKLAQKEITKYGDNLHLYLSGK